MPTLDHQIAIVTGAARGIGLGVARRLAAEGARVAVWDRDLAPLATSGFTPALAQVVDITDRAAVAAAFAAVEAQLGAVDILVNNAGINGPVLPAWDYPQEAWDRVIATNLTGVFHCCAAAVPAMRARRRGRIVSIASIAGKEGVPGISAYSAAKAGVIAFSKSLAKELATDGVLVNCVAPAITETELFREMTPEHIAAMKAKIPMGRPVRIEEIAGLVAFIAGPDCSFTTGFTFDITGGRATY